jgi:putative tricarboxylic transport membrane protein
MFALGALGAPLFARLLKMAEPVLMAQILMFSLVGAFVVRGNPVDLLVCVIAGVAGVILRYAQYPVAPIVIGMALGTTFETKLRQGLIAARGDIVVFLSDPIAIFILLATLALGIPPLLKYRREQMKKRQVN